MENQQQKIVNHIKVKFEQGDFKFKGNKLQFAEKVGCDPKTLRDVFNGNHYMSMNLFLKFCKALELKPSELLGEVGL